MSTKRKSGQEGPRIFISSGEQSADRIGAAFIRAFRSIRPEARFCGIGGEAMREEGLEGIGDLTVHSAMWLAGSLALMPRLWRLLRKCRDLLDRERPDAVVVIDYPGFHFYLAREAKRRGIPSIYYVTPQIWGYNPYRAVKMRKIIDRALVVWPFEEAFLAARGISALYVGHPLIEELRQEWGEDLAEPGDPPVLGILPGSRRQEVVAAMPHMSRAARRIRESVPNLRILASASRPEMRHTMEEALRRSEIPFEILEGKTAEVFRGSRLTLVTSGTTTVEGVFHGSPMVVLYRIPAISYWGSRPWQLTRHIALPNILAGDEVIPEFVLYGRRDGPFLEAARRAFGDPEDRKRIRAGLLKVREALLQHRDASAAAAREVARIATERNVASSV